MSYICKYRCSCLSENSSVKPLKTLQSRLLRVTAIRRIRIIRHMGSVHPDAVDGLVKIAYLELARIQEARHPTLFPAESYVDEVVAARKKKREDKALVIKDARKLHEIRRICLGFHEVIGMIRWGLQRCLILVRRWRDASGGVTASGHTWGE